MSTYFSMTPTIMAALQSAAIAKGSPLSDAERAAVYARFTSAPPAAPALATFTHTVAELLAANEQWLNHVSTHDAGVISALAAQPANAQPPLRVRKNLRVDDYHKLLAAKQRGDTTVVCTAATVQEEMSA